MVAGVVAELGGGEIDVDTGWPTVAEVLQTSGVVASRSAGRRAATEGGAYLNNRRATDGDATLGPDDLLHGRWVIARRGKRTVGAVTITGA